MQTPDSGFPPPARRRRVSRRWIAVAALGVAAVLTVVLGIEPRRNANAALGKETADRNVMTVSAISPKPSAGVRDVVLPGNVQAYSDTAVAARTNGYVKQWHADIGKQVKAGELLAELDTPEVDDQLRQATADLANAQATLQLAQTTAARWEDLAKSGIVTKQDLEEKRSQLAARRAATESARSQVARLQKLQSFKHVRAPFAGVITARNVDVGTLVDAGGASGRELFHLAATQRLRVFVHIPQMHAKEAVPGIEAELVLPELPGRKVKGRLARSTQAIDATHRTLLAEVDVDNPDGELLPGAYAEVHLKLPAGASRALMLPVNALLFRPEGVMVALVGADQRAKLVPVTLGRDFGTEVEIVTGLAGSELVIINPSDSLISGMPVRVVKEAPATAKPKS